MDQNTNQNQGGSRVEEEEGARPQDVGDAGPSGRRQVRACRSRRAVLRDGGEDTVVVVSDSAGEGAVAAKSRGNRKGRKRAALESQTASSEEEEDPPHRKFKKCGKRDGRGRPALNPAHKGMFTAEALERKREVAEAERLRRDHKAILNPKIKAASNTAKRANRRAADHAYDYDDEPIVAVQAEAFRALGIIAKSLERSRNIKGDISRDMWNAYAMASGALSSIVGRTAPRDEGEKHGGPPPLPGGEGPPPPNGCGNAAS